MSKIGTSDCKQEHVFFHELVKRLLLSKACQYGRKIETFRLKKQNTYNHL